MSHPGIWDVHDASTTALHPQAELCLLTRQQRGPLPTKKGGEPSPSLQGLGPESHVRTPRIFVVVKIHDGISKIPDRQVGQISTQEPLGKFTLEHRSNRSSRTDNRSVVERLDQRLQPPFQRKSIIVNEGNDRILRLGNASISRSRKTELVFHNHSHHVGVILLEALRDLQRVVSRAIVHYQEFPLTSRITTCRDLLQCLSQKCRAISGTNNDRDVMSNLSHEQIITEHPLSMSTDWNEQRYYDFMLKDLSNPISFILVLLLCAAPLKASPSALDHLVRVVQGNRVHIDMNRTTLTIHVSPTAEPGIRAWSEPNEADRLDQLVVVKDSTGALITRSSPEGDSPLPRISVEIHLRSDQQLIVMGHDLDLTISFDSEAPQPDEIPSGPQIDVSNSSIRCIGQIPSRLVAISSTVDLEGGTGDIHLELESSQVEIRQLVGNIGAKTVGGDLRVKDAEGKLTANMSQGTLMAGGISGPLSIQVEDGAVDLQDCQGQTNITARSSDIGIYGLSAPQVTVHGSDLRVTAARLTANGSFLLASSTVDLQDLNGNLTLRLTDGCQIEADGLVGEVGFHIEGPGSSARLSRLDGPLQAFVADGRFEVEDAKSMNIECRHADIELTNILSLGKVLSRACTLRLNLPESSTKPFLTLAEGSQATATLGQPCLVEANGKGSNLQLAVTVLGCNLKNARSGRSTARSALTKHAAVTLRANMDETSTLDVVSSP